MQTIYVLASRRREFSHSIQEAILKDCTESNSLVDEFEVEPVSGSSLSTQSHFSPEQLAKFEERYENSYDIYTDQDYVAWL